MLNRSVTSNVEWILGERASSVNLRTRDSSGSPHPIMWSTALTYCRVLVLTEIVD